MRLTDDRLDELEAAARRATPGPWAQSLDPDHWAVIYGRGGACICTLNAWVDALDEAQANARHVAAADPATVMALVTAAAERRYYVNAFSHKLVKVNVLPRQRLDDVVRLVSGLRFGGTDCALPMLEAARRGLEVDAFVVYTDSETWVGDVHPVQALQAYRQKFGIPAKLVIVGMVSNGFTIADPDDGGMLDVVGFDTATPNLMSDFITGGEVA